MAKKLDLSGKQSSRLSVLEEDGRNTQGAVLCKCVCICGNYTTVRGADLKKNGNTKSCGCLNKEVASTKRGKKHPSYNYNLAVEDKLCKRNVSEYKEWHKQVLKRDNYVCRCCGACKRNNFAVHHKNGYDNFPNLRTVLENCITLCKKCCRDFHCQCGYGNNTAKQFEKFIYVRKKLMGRI